MKHFEDIWEEAENVSKTNCPEWDDLCDELKNKVAELSEGWQDTEETEQVLGDVLFYLCMITEIKGANSWTALENRINNEKISLYDED